MKRLLFSLIALGGLALASAPMANAAAPVECGKSYAMLITGALPSEVSQDGSSTLPGALTPAVGVGVITFGAAAGNTCASITGELIYNAGDLQANPVGVTFGPNSCFQQDSLFITGIPCFDGADHFAGSTLAPSAFGNGALQLNLVAGFNWMDGSVVAGTYPIAFTLQQTLGGSIVVGNSVSDDGVSATPILAVTMQKITTTGAAACTNTAGYAGPYLGLTSVLCSGGSANTSDFPASLLNASTMGFAGAWSVNTGALQIFNATQAGGSLSFNGNDDEVQTGATVTQNNDCSFNQLPDTAFNTRTGCGNNPHCYDSALPLQGDFAFADCTSNTTAVVSDSGPSCAFTAAGFEFALSTVQWSATNKSSYGILTGIAGSGTGEAFLPAVVMTTCTTYPNSPAGLISNLMVPTAYIAPDVGSSPTTAMSGYIKFTNTSPADCHVTATFSGVTSDANCKLTVDGTNTSANADVLPDSPSTIVFQPRCTCTAEDTSSTINATMTVTSSDCPLSGVTVHSPITCSN